MNKKVQAKYLEHCRDRVKVGQTPLSYLNWMESKLEACMNFRDTIEPCSICAGYMLKENKNFDIGRKSFGQ